VLIDFHTHSSASDGALTPVELLDRAQAAGIDMFAITDHDSMAGYREAAEYCAAGAVSVQLVPGTELSCQWSGCTVHVVGLGIDCDHPAMVDALGILDKARQDRGATIARRLEGFGFKGALAGAIEEAGQSQLGRPHFAHWLVRLETVTRWIVDAGGVAVLAHPLKYRFTRMKLRRLVTAFQAVGGEAIEISSGRQSADQVRQLRQIALEFELEVSLGSDFHRDFPHSAGLGVELPRLHGLRGVWQRWAGDSVEGEL
jgi:predicted metal-dependent phosphoesterase TrpH